MLVNFYKTGKLMLNFNIDGVTANHYKVNDIINIPTIDGKILKINIDKKTYTTKQYAIIKIQHSFNVAINNVDDCILDKMEAGLEIELEEMRTFKLKQILKLC